MSELPNRPVPPRRLIESAVSWLGWFGAARMARVALSIAVVLAGGFWLLRAPLPAPESTLPRVVSSAVAATFETLPLPLPEVAPASGLVVVHVAGAVVNPGVYELDASSRVFQAVAIAGGPTANAELAAINLAAPIVDGQRLYLPSIGEVDPANIPSGPNALSGPVGPTDLNSATAAELELLPGVGPSTAAAIVDDRERNGPFVSVDDLDRVSGIGPATLDSLRGLVTV